MDYSSIRKNTFMNYEKERKISEINKEVLNSKLLFVIDSPKSKELDDNNTKLIMDFFKKKLSGNQVLIFSIFTENELFIDFDKIITFNKRAIENRNSEKMKTE